MRKRRTSGHHKARELPPPSSRRAEEVSSQRARLAPDSMPAAWLHALLMASIDLPLAAGERAVVEAMVGTVASILPDYAIGACFVPEPGAGRREQLVVRRVPDGAAEPRAGIDPTRVFSGFAHEHVATIYGTTTGSTLHAASDEDPLDDRSSAARFVTCAADVLGRAVVRARDISSFAASKRDEHSLQDRLIQTDKLATFGQIAAGMVHELNNPLTSIVAYSDLLIRKALAPGGAHDAEDVERLKRIGESANRMLRFTRDLVTYARPSGGIIGPVVLHGVIDQAIAFCEHVLADARVAVDRRYHDEVRTVRGVSEQLVQVFVNLLTNACQATLPQGGRIAVTTSVAGGGRRAIIVVEDDGVGIAAEHLEQVFAPFFTTKGDRHGTGLGLSIVKSIVERHDGEIRVASEPGRGARFEIELPAGR